MTTAIRQISAKGNITRKQEQARALHDLALRLGTIPGCERDANNVSKEAAIADAEVEHMLRTLPASQN